MPPLRSVVVAVYRVLDVVISWQRVVHAEQPRTAPPKNKAILQWHRGGNVICVNYDRHYLPKKLTRLQTGSMVASPFLPPMTKVLALQGIRFVVRSYKFYKIVSEYCAFVWMSMWMCKARSVRILPVLETGTEIDIASYDDFLPLKNTHILRNRWFTECINNREKESRSWKRER